MKSQIKLLPSNLSASNDVGNIPDVWIEPLKYFWVTANFL